MIRHIQNNQYRSALNQSAVGFLLVILTQNGFQDAEVRFTLTLLCSFIFLAQLHQPIKGRTF